MKDTRMKYLKLKVSDYIALTATMIALTSFAVSVRSCQQTERAVALAEREFEESRMFFWLGIVDSTMTLQLTPSNADAKIQSVSATLPYIFDTGMNAVNPRTFAVSLNNADKHLRVLLERPREFDTQDGFEVANTARPTMIPIALESRYVVKGQSRVDRGLYHLAFEPTMFIDPRNPSYTVKEIEYSQLRFVRNLTKDVGAATEVENAWRKHMSERTRPAA